MPVSSVNKGNEEGIGNRARDPQLLFFFFFKCSVNQNWDRTDPKCKEGSHKPKLDKQNPQSLHFFLFCFFFSNKDRRKNKIGKRVERQMSKHESICLGNGKNGCRAHPATPTTPTKTAKQPLQQLTADQISKFQLRWHPWPFQVSPVSSRWTHLSWDSLNQRVTNALTNLSVEKTIVLCATKLITGDS